MGNSETYRSAQMEYYTWLKRQEYLRTGRFSSSGTIEEKSKYHLGDKFVGKPVSAEKLAEIFGKGVQHYIQTFANNLYFKNNWRKFAISQAKHRFSKDENMMFFEIGELLPAEAGVEIIYLGTGGTNKIPLIGNQIAADSWGFAVLNLREEE